MTEQADMVFNNPAQWTAAIKAKALALGFDKVGVLSAAFLRDNAFFARQGQQLQTWLSLGYQADMAWMGNYLDKRLDPLSLMDNTQAIVCVAINHYQPDGYDPNDPNALKIAKYARGTDYHHVLKKRLKELLRWIQSIDPNVIGRALTDSAPILEKPLAQLAGIGWLGKNGTVITPELGSFVFLGELFLSLPLDNDMAEVSGSCGRCRRCIEACPTDAILNSDETRYGVVDAQRCISYWTIESKAEAFPAEISENLNGWVFGCDVCQDVCPWNIKFAVPAKEPQFQVRPWNQLPNADELLSMDEPTFAERYAKSPIKRTRLNGFKRNIKAAMGNKKSDKP